MTATELLKHRKTFENENGVLVLLSVLETLFEANEQAGCIELLDDDELEDAELDGLVVTYVTFQ